MKKLVIALLLLAAVTGTGSAVYAQVTVGVSIRVAPPPLRVYTQPSCPYNGYIWTPGYWAYGPSGYYWIPGNWVPPPRPGVLWTPGYWGFVGGIYNWHAGYWGPHVGFYGGVNYGYGYTGSGFYGGIWRGNVYHYNTAYANINTRVVHNTYVNNTYINNRTIVNNRSSFNGPGGVNARPNRVEMRQGFTSGNHAGSEERNHQAVAQNHFDNSNRGNHFSNAGNRAGPRENHFNSGGGNRQVAMQHPSHFSGGMQRGGHGGGHGRH